MVQRESNILTHPDSSGCGRYAYKSEVSAPLSPTWGAVKTFGWAYKPDPVGTRCSASVLGLPSRPRRSASLPFNSFTASRRGAEGEREPLCRKNSSLTKGATAKRQRSHSRPGVVLKTGKLNISGSTMPSAISILVFPLLPCMTTPAPSALPPFLRGNCHPASAHFSQLPSPGSCEKIEQPPGNGPFCTRGTTGGFWSGDLQTLIQHRLPPQVPPSREGGQSEFNAFLRCHHNFFTASRGGARGTEVRRVFRETRECRHSIL